MFDEMAFRAYFLLTIFVALDLFVSILEKRFEHVELPAFVEWCLDMLKFTRDMLLRITFVVLLAYSILTIWYT